MKLLVIGSGGREHALCWALSASPLCDEIWCAPGSAAIEAIAKCVPLKLTDYDGLMEFALQERFDLVVIGPEQPLTDGLADRLRAAGMAVFGPSAEAAQLEGSKGFARDFCKRHHIPSPDYQRCSTKEAALAYVNSRKDGPLVIKADGLAAGKGVIVAANRQDSLAAVESLWPISHSLVIEECLVGEELSFFALSDGEQGLALGGVQDHKRAYDGDYGPNTGGMGAYFSQALCSPSLQQQIMQEIVTPTIQGMAAEGRKFQGVLFCGLMLTKDGPKIIEYNVRFGDPECQILMVRLQSDLLPILLACSQGGLQHTDLRWQDQAVLGVVVASRGYPDRVNLTKEEALMKGLSSFSLVQPAAKEGDSEAIIFHAGTDYDKMDGWYAKGGRVLTVTAKAPNLKEAAALAYRIVTQIDWPYGHYRRDIGWRQLAREAGKLVTTPAKS